MSKTTAKTYNAMRPLSHADLILTYKCIVSCRHYDLCCGSSKDGLMSIDDAKRYLVDLKKLGADTPTISGGEPFLYEELVTGVLKLVQEVYGYSDVWILTNAFWCKDDVTVRRKYEFLHQFCGAVMSSVDYFHFEQISIDFVRRSLNMAADVFGLHHIPHFTDDLTWYAFKSLVSCIEAVKFEGVELTGNAAFALAPFVPGKPAKAFSSTHCAKELFEYDSIHIDPYGNVFPSCRCKGIVLGNARELMEGFTHLLPNPNLENWLMR